MRSPMHTTFPSNFKASGCAMALAVSLCVGTGLARAQEGLFDLREGMPVGTLVMGAPRGVDAAQVAAGADRAGPITPQQREQARTMIERAIAYLRSQQDGPTGGWGIRPGAPVFPAISGLVLSGMLMDPAITDADPSVQAGVKFLITSQKPDGGIYDTLLPSYNTAISLTALTKVNSPAQVADVRARAIDFLRSIQYGEGAQAWEGLAEAARPVDRSDPYYGGWGYGNRGRPDLSNTAFALEALHAAGVESTDPAIQRAIVFLQRCQMLERTPDGSPVNDMAYAKGSSQGGFIYATSINKDNVGVGQSFAGEIHESSDSIRGAMARVKLGIDKEGKPVTLKKSEVDARIRAEAAKPHNPDTAQGIVPFRLSVTLGPTGDGIASNEFEVRGSTTPARLEAIIAAALAGQLAETDAISTRETTGIEGPSRLRAYGSMTYSGYKSLIYAGLRRDDPRVVAAKEWIQRHYTLSENPGMGTDGYYYYLVAFAKALEASGQDEVLTTNMPGAKAVSNWRADLIAQMATLQNADGSFRSVDDRWMENDPVLITAYSLLALQHAVK